MSRFDDLNSAKVGGLIYAPCQSDMANAAYEYSARQQANAMNFVVSGSYTPLTKRNPPIAGPSIGGFLMLVGFLFVAGVLQIIAKGVFVDVIFAAAGLLIGLLPLVFVEPGSRAWKRRPWMRWTTFAWAALWTGPTLFNLWLRMVL